MCVCMYVFKYINLSLKLEAIKFPYKTACHVFHIPRIQVSLMTKQSCNTVVVNCLKLLSFDRLGSRENPLCSSVVPLARHAMRNIWWCTFISFILFPAESSHCVSMMQRQALPLTQRPKPKPWEVNNYIVANYHKAGVYLSNSLARTIFEILDAPDAAFGHVEYPCDPGNPLTCWNMEAPVRIYTDAFNASVKSAELLKSKGKKLLVAGFVRDPLEMVASAYCYHHVGQELSNVLFPVAKIMQMGLKEGTELTAETLFPLAEWMASVFEHPDQNTLRLELDEMTNSSTGFDLGVQRFPWLHWQVLSRRSVPQSIPHAFFSPGNPSSYCEHILVQVRSG